MNFDHTLVERAQALQDHLQALQDDIEAQKQHALELERMADISPANNAGFIAFLHKPYLLRLLHKDKYELIIPKFLNFKAGWPVATLGEYSIFQVSRFIDLITPLPEWLKNELGFEKEAFKAHIEDQFLVVDQGNVEEVLKRLGGPKRFGRKQGNKITMIGRYRFDILRDLIRQGVLPYTPQRIDQEHMREGRSKIELRDKQKRDFQTFLEFGAVSVFATGGAGKTFFGMKALDVLKGRKAILAPRRSILDQWKARLQAFAPHVLQDEVEFRTYQSLKNKPMTGKFGLIIYDEIQHMPAAMGIRASQAESVARVGLTATPWREDGNEDLIPALCGVPVGIDWESGKPAATTLWIVEKLEDKFKQLKQIMQHDVQGKTLIFVYRLDVGEKISKMLGIPFVSGRTSKQYEVIESTPSMVISKVGDAGISIDARRVIDFDWLGGRAEAGQRALRTQHAQGNAQLHLIMTKHEYQTDVKRLIALHSLNFDIKVMNGGTKNK